MPNFHLTFRALTLCFSFFQSCKHVQGTYHRHRWLQASGSRLSWRLGWAGWLIGDVIVMRNVHSITTVNVSSFLGVLLLNAVLTVKASSANSHKDKGWEKFTDAIIAHVNNNLSGVVFLLWGNYAQKKGAKINQVRHVHANWSSMLDLLRARMHWVSFRRTSTTFWRECIRPLFRRTADFSVVNISQSVTSSLKRTERRPSIGHTCPNRRKATSGLCSRIS